MKNRILSLLLLCILSTYSQAQQGGWSCQHPVSTSSHLYDITFSDDNFGWIVSEAKTILHSNDSGITWKQLPPQTNHNFYSVYFLNANEGWITGGRVVLKTIDDGASWTRQYPSLEPIMDIQFFNGQYGFAVGKNGQIAYTKDGGANWEKQYCGSANSLTSIFFLDTANVWVCGNYGTILHSSTAGFMSVASGIREVKGQRQNTISIYPNPCDGWLELEVSGPYNVNVYDLTGHLVFGKTNITNKQIKLKNIEPCMYTISVRQDEKQHSGKLIVR